LTFLAAQADRLILGKLVSLDTLGLYGIALALSRVSEQLITVLSHQVLFPVLSRQKLVGREDLRAVLLRHRSKLLLALGGLAVVPICAGDLIVDIIYPPRYADAGAMLSTLSWAGWLVGLTVTGKQALFAIGAPKYNALATGLRFALILLGLPLAFSQGGLHSAVLLMVGAEVPVYVVNSIGMRRHGLGCLRQDVTLSLALLVVAAAVLSLRHLLGWGFPWAGL
jgi:O-antigen/teichoic acid export membrane protein